MCPWQTPVKSTVQRNKVWVNKSESKEHILLNLLSVVLKQAEDSNYIVVADLCNAVCIQISHYSIVV